MASKKSFLALSLIASLMCAANAQGQVVNADDCANANFINGTGLFGFNNLGSTSVGPDHIACEDGLIEQGIGSDVWANWTAPCTGFVKLDTCGLTLVDTRIAVYSGSVCPTDDSTLLDCSDDDPDCLLQSRVWFQASAGSSYLIRLGTYPGAPPGTGQFNIDMVCDTQACSEPIENCQDFDFTGASASDGANIRIAENFTPNCSGDLSSICWWGEYDTINPRTDNFTIRYYDDNAGVPGNLLATFTQGTSLSVSGPLQAADEIDGGGNRFVIYGYTANHAALSLSAEQQYWVEITNPVGLSGIWFWEFAKFGDEISIRDTNPLGYDQTDLGAQNYAFCTNVIQTAPPEPLCVGAVGACDTGGNGTAGCDDLSCCERVCLCDPCCCEEDLSILGCTGIWDAACAGLGFGDNGCGAAAICGAPCGACVNIDVADPVNCSMDIAIPHDRGSSTSTFAPSTFTLTMTNGGDADCDTSNVDVANFSIRFEPVTPIGAPSISDVIVINNVATVELTGPLPAGVWTCISHSAGEEICSGSLPGDINRNGISDGSDVGTMKAALTLGSAEDIDRSGSQTTLDLITTLDLLAGADAFSVWLDEFAGPCPTP